MTRGEGSMNQWLKKVRKPIDDYPEDVVQVALPQVVSSFDRRQQEDSSSSPENLALRSDVARRAVERKKIIAPLRLEYFRDQENGYAQLHKIMENIAHTAPTFIAEPSVQAQMAEEPKLTLVPPDQRQTFLGSLAKYSKSLAHIVGNISSGMEEVAKTSDRGKYLRVLTPAEILGIIERGGMYYVEDEAKKFVVCGYADPAGAISIADLRRTIHDQKPTLPVQSNEVSMAIPEIPVRKVGGIAGNGRAMLEYLDTFKLTEYDDQLLVARTHEGLANVLVNRFGYLRYSLAELKEKLPAVYALYFKNNKAEDDRAVFVRFPKDYAIPIKQLPSQLAVGTMLIPSGHDTALIKRPYEQDLPDTA